MDNTPRTPRPASRLAYRLSFLAGAVCAIPEFSNARVFRTTQPAVARIEAIAPNLDGFTDGYDLVADRACAHIVRPTFGRELISCFLRGHSEAVSA